MPSKSQPEALGKLETIEIEGQRVPIYPKRIADDEIYAAMAMIPVSKIDIDVYQRHLDERRAAKIARDWEDVGVHTLMVAAREKNRYACIDGQHRARGAEIRGIEYLMCEVLIGLQPQQEARIFDLVNGKRRSVHPLDLYKNRLFAKDPTTLRVEKIVNACGYHVNYGSFRRDARGIVSVKTLYTLYAWDVLEQTLTLIDKAWPEDSMATDRQVLLAVGALCFNYPDLEESRFGRELHQEGLRSLMSEARSYGRESTFMLAKFMLNAYNRGLSTNRLNSRALEMPPLNAMPRELQEKEALLVEKEAV